MTLTSEQQRLLEVIYLSYTRDGAARSPEDQKRLSEINSSLAAPIRKFADNVTRASKDAKLIVEDKRRLGGIPADMVAAASKKAAQNGTPGKWMFTADQATAEAFLTLAEDRDLRKQMYDNYINRGIDGGATDNRDNIRRILKGRQEKAKILGYDTYAHYVLEQSSAKSPEKVEALLKKLWGPTLKRATDERARLQKYIDDEGGAFQASSLGLALLRREGPP